jgi:PhnB protein
VVQLEQNLTFQGDCEDAIDLYVSAFDANITSLIRYRDTDQPHPAAMAHKIASAELTIFDATLSMADGRGEGGSGSPAVGIALQMPDDAIRQAVTVLSGSRASWWLPDNAVDTTAVVEIVDPHGVRWCFSGLPPLAA